MKEQKYFFTLKDIKYHLVDTLGLIWDGTIMDFKTGENIPATLENITFLNVAHLTITNGILGKFDLPVTINNEEFYTWEEEVRPWNDDTMRPDKNLSSAWQQRLLENNGQPYADYLSRQKENKKASEHSEDYLSTALKNCKRFNEEFKGTIDRMGDEEERTL